MKVVLVLRHIQQTKYNKNRWKYSIKKFFFQVTNLFRELLFAQFVQSEKFPGQSYIVDKTTAGEFYTNDDLSVRHHHSHCTELDFKVLREFLPPSVTRVHSQENSWKLMTNTFVDQTHHTIFHNTSKSGDVHPSVRMERKSSSQITEFWVHIDHIAIREYELLLSLFLAHKYDVDLLCSHW